jgi:hypothetical protein
VDNESTLDREHKDHETKVAERQEARQARQDALGRDPVDNVEDTHQARQEALGREQPTATKEEAPPETETQEKEPKPKAKAKAKSE